MRPLLIATLVITALLLTMIVGTDRVCAQETESQEAPEVRPAPKARLNPELLRRWRQMTPEQRRLMRKRLEHLQQLSSEKRQRILENMERFRKLSPEEKKRFIETRHRMKDVPLDVRRRMKHQMRRLVELPPEHRRRVMRRFRLARMFLSSEMEALRRASEEERPALHRIIHRKLWVLSRLKREEIEELRQMEPEERDRKLKELFEKMPPMRPRGPQRPGHGLRPRHRRGKGPGRDRPSDRPAD